VLTEEQARQLLESVKVVRKTKIVTIYSALSGIR